MSRLQRYVTASILVGLVALGFRSVHAVEMANGIKIGEVHSTSAIIWSRLTKHAERNINGTPFNESNDKKQIPKPVKDIDSMEAAVPGTSGEIRVTWSSAKQDTKSTSDWKKVTAKTDFTSQLKLKDLLPGSLYHVVVEGRVTGSDKISCRVKGSFRTSPAADQAAPVKFTVVTGQDYPRRDDLANGHKIYPHMKDLGIDFFVHTGDIEYYDKPNPKAVNQALARFKWNRLYSMPNQRDFHNHTSSYFIKDDHDTLKNDSWPGQTYGDLTWEQGLNIFREQVPMGDKTYRTIRWGKDLQVWLVEGRDFRSPNTMTDGPDKTIWGEEQKAWFYKTVKESDATFRILISPTPVVGPDRGGKNDNHANKGFTHEGDEVRAFIGKQKNMFVVCGDRHWQYVSVDPKSGVREYSCGPTSDKHASGFSEKNRSDMHQYLKIKGGFLSVSIERENETPKAIFRHYSTDGKVYNEDVQTAK
ncbi:MAG: alkaline phosphatase D family protein [Pirellulales bacterium]